MRNRFLIALFSIFSITACSDDVTLVDLPVPTEIRLTPAAASVTQLERGETLQVVATMIDNRNNPIPDVEILWESSNTNVVSVTRDGLITARSVGTAQVTAISGALRSTINIIVVRESVARVNINLNVPPAGLIIGNSIIATATALSVRGDTITRYGTSWTSSDASVAVVSSAGVITGVSAGTSTITASIDGVSTSTNVRVIALIPTQLIVAPMAISLERGERSEITAKVLDQFGGTMNSVPVTWESSNANVASVSTTGTIVAVGVGSATITAVTGTLRAQTTVFVTREAVSRVVINVEFPSDGFVISSSVTATATAFSVRGDTITRYGTTWTSSAAGIASISSTGIITAVSEGTAVITATIDGVSATTSVRVVAPPAPPARVPTRIEVVPVATQIERGATTTISAVVLDQFGDVVEGSEFAWTSATPNVATVSNEGVVTGVQLGQTEVVVTSGVLVARATIFVVAEAVNSVVVNVALPTGGLLVGNTATSTATALSARGNVITGFAVVWTSSETSVATVSQTGLITAVSEGRTTISATISGVTGGIEVTTQLVPVASVTLATATTTTYVGRTNQVLPTLLSASGNELTAVGRTLTWESSNPAVVNVSDAGVITGVATGTARVSLVVTSHNTTPRVGFIDVQVTQVEVDSVEVVGITNATSTVVLGSTNEYRARAFDEDGAELTAAELDGRTFTWSLSVPVLIVTPGITTTHLNRWYTAVGEGGTVIGATIGGVRGEFEVFVVPPTS